MGREGRDGSTRHIDDLTKINNEVGGGGGRRGLTAVVSDSVSLATNARVYFLLVWLGVSDFFFQDTICFFTRVIFYILHGLSSFFWSHGSS